MLSDAPFHQNFSDFSDKNLHDKKMALKMVGKRRITFIMRGEKKKKKGKIQLYEDHTGSQIPLLVYIMTMNSNLGLNASGQDE